MSNRNSRVSTRVKPETNPDLIPGTKQGLPALTWGKPGLVWFGFVLVWFSKNRQNVFSVKFDFFFLLLAQTFAPDMAHLL